MQEDKLNKDIDLNKLAYLGDAFFELYTRNKLYDKYKDEIDMNEMHKLNTNLVCAKNQSKFIDKLLDENLLTENELMIYKSARNLHTNTKSKNSPVRDYRKATGLEALIGYLYIINNTKRALEILSYYNIE